MNNISKDLINNPNYYIEGGDIIITNLDIINNQVNYILNNFSDLDLEYDDFNDGFNILRLNKLGNNIGYISFYKGDNNWIMEFSIINNGKNGESKFNNNNDYQGKGYGKILYILVGIEALKNNRTFISDHYESILSEAKYIWNSLVNTGLAEYDEDLKRFKFINNMLEDYFPKQIKNSD